MALTWFDAHLDLAYLAVSGREMAPPAGTALDAAGGPHPPAAVTLRSLAQGGVRFSLGTIFTEPVEPEGAGTAKPAPALEPQMYTAGDAGRAHAVGRAQLEAYRTWQDRGLVRLGLVEELRVDAGLGEIRGGMGVSEVVQPSIASRIALLRDPECLRVGILMENADPIRTADELEWWKSHGVVAIGLAWARASRYAGGNTTDLGLSDAGRELVREMDRLDVVHDVSHLSDRALRELLDATDTPVIASHSNCRALLGAGPPPGWPPNLPASLSMQRHLADDTIREIGRRGGVIGLNLFSRFLVGPGRGDARASIDDCVRHIEHVCEIMGHRRGVGLGSDMDGGFSAKLLPEGIDAPRDLARLAQALVARRWADDDIRGFACENWARFFLERHGAGRR
ncbi:MAG: dipeptidase [Phycisphaerales bacterium]